MEHQLQQLFEFFESKQIEAYLVGGAVRDMLQGIKPKDYDFSTPNTPDEIRSKCKDIVNPDIVNPLSDNSSQFGTMFLNIFDENIFDEPIEITTFRKDISRGRKPETMFTKRLEIDAMRRDFNINALYMEKDGNIIDPTGWGESNINNNILSTVGSAFDRLTEDPLRILRAIRFMTLGFKADFDLLHFMKKLNHKELLGEISIERIRDEFLKILSINALKGLKLLKKYKLLEIIIPEITSIYGFNQERPQYHKWGLFNHSVLTAFTLQVNGADPELILIGFLHDIGKPISMKEFDDYLAHDNLGSILIEEIFKRMNFSKKSTQRAYGLVRHHMRLHNNQSQKNLLKSQHIMRKAGIDEKDLFNLYHADLWGSRFEASVLMPLEMPNNPINGHVGINLLDKFGSTKYELIGEIIEKSWEILFKSPNISLDNLESRLIDFTRSKLE